MHRSTDVVAGKLHEIMQPLNVIRLSCGNIRVRMAGYSNEDAQYLLGKMIRIEEQVIRATHLLQELNKSNEDRKATNDY